jgi:hypothetical protein
VASIHLADDACFNMREICASGVHFAEQLFRQILMEDLADHIEDMVCAQFVPDLRHTLHELLKHTASRVLTAAKLMMRQSRS